MLLMYTANNLCSLSTHISHNIFALGSVSTGSVEIFVIIICLFD